MNELESFINTLNQILDERYENDTEQIPAPKYEKLVNYLFSESTWPILKSLYSQNIQINVAVAEKLVNLLIDICTKLLINLNSYNDLNIDSNVEIYLKKDLNNFSNSTNSLFKNEIKLEQTEPTGSLIYYLIICLELYLQYNDGTNNSPLQNNNTILTGLANALFNKYDSSMSPSHHLVQSIYLKFLGKLFKLNFANLIKKNIKQLINTSSGSGNLTLTRINNLFIKQFAIVEKTITLEMNKLLFLKICINYLYDYSLYTNFISTSEIDGSSIASNATLFNLNSQACLAFEGLLNLFDVIQEFVFQNMLLLDYEEPWIENSSDESKLSDEISDNSSFIDSGLSYWKKVCH